MIAAERNDITFIGNTGVDFDPLSQFAEQKITFADAHGFDDGDPVVYRHTGGTAIGGLDEATTYQVIYIDDTTIKLSSVVNGSDVVSSPVAGSVGFEFGVSSFVAIDSSAATFDANEDSITFSDPHGLTDGQSVVYRGGLLGQKDDSGLIDGTAYVVEIDGSNSDKVRLKLDVSDIEHVDLGTLVVAPHRLVYFGTDPEKLTEVADPSDIQAVIQKLVIDLKEDIDVDASGDININVDANLTTGSHIFLGSELQLNIDEIKATDNVRLKTKNGIISVDPTGMTTNVASGNLILEAGDGGIGESTNAFMIDLDTGATLTARATLDVHIAEQAGDMEVDFVFSEGNVALVADGSIVDGKNDDLSNVESDSLYLNAGTSGLATGGVGTSGNFFDVDIPFIGQLDVDAVGDIYLADTVGEMPIGQIKSTMGNVSLQAAVSIIDANNTLAQDGITLTGNFDDDVIGNDITLKITEPAPLGAGIGGPADLDLDIDSAYSSTGGLTVDSRLSAYVLESMGDLTLYNVLVSAGEAFINSGGSILSGNTSGGFDVEAPTARFISGGDTGTSSDPIITDVDDVEGVIGNDTYIVNTGELNVGASGGFDGIEAMGSVNITAMSPVVISENIITTDISSAGDIIITATDSATAGDDITLLPNITVESIAGSVELLSGDDVMLPADSLIKADVAITIRGDYQSTGSDPDSGVGTTVLLQGSLDAPTIEIYGNADDDVFDFDLDAATETITGTASVFGGDGEDDFNINLLPSLNLGDTLNLDGQDGTDKYVIDVHGGNATIDYVINVLDTGAPDLGADTLTIEGSSDPDAFLLRKEFVAVLHSSDAMAPYGSTVERINYDQNINARLQVNGYAGDDLFASDNNSSITTLDGGAGADIFQIGQIFASTREFARVAAGDEINTTRVIIGDVIDGDGNTIFSPTDDALDDAKRAEILAALDPIDGSLTGIGYISNGVTQPTIIYGGEGNDVFNVYRNVGILRLEGEAGNDEFVIRAFATLPDAGTTVADQETTEVAGGDGDDFVQYAINAPVDIDGGAGFDKVVVIGTPFNDNFAVTQNGVFGAGLSVFYVGIESAEVDSLEGDDNIFVIGTKRGVVTTLIAGKGHDIVNVGGDVTATVIAGNELTGSAGVVDHQVSSTGGRYQTGVFADGVGLLVVDANPSSASLDFSTTEIRVAETGLSGSYTITAPASIDLTNTVLYLTVSAALASKAEQDAATLAGTLADTVEVSSDGVTFQRSVVLTFDENNRSHTITVNAVDDTAAEGIREVQVSHSLNASPNTTPYEDLPLPNVAVTVLDDEVDDLIITESQGTTEVLEGAAAGGSSVADMADDIYTISLTSAPASGETVDVSFSVGDSRVTFSPSSISFTDADWNQPKIVKVVASVAKDGDPNNPFIVDISHTVTSSLGASGFNAANPGIVELTIHDGDQAGAIVRETNLGVELDPATAISGNKVQLGPKHGLFSGDPVVYNNGDGTNIGGLMHGGIYYAVVDSTDPTKIELTTSRSDALANPPTSIVSLNANGSSGTSHRLDPVAGSSTSATKVIENGPDDFYVVVLTDSPDAGETVSINVRPDDQVTADPTSLTFDDADWFVPQTVAVTALQASNSTDKPFRSQAHTLSKIGGPLIVEGGVGSGKDRGLRAPLILPTETDTGSLSTNVAYDDSGDIDVLNVFHDGNVSDEKQSKTMPVDPAEGQLTDADELGLTLGSLTHNNLFGFGMGGDLTQDLGDGTSRTTGGGITFGQFEIMELMLGQGDEVLNVDVAVDVADNTADGHGMVMAIHGGGGADSITAVNDRIASNGDASPMVIYGDTSHDGSRYVSPGGSASSNALAFANPGNDTIDASSSTQTVTIYGGPGNDTIDGGAFGDHIAGGIGDDIILAHGGSDLVYGDSGFNVDLVTREVTVAHSTSGSLNGADQIGGGQHNDVIFGDYGQINDGTLPLTTTDGVAEIQTVNVAHGGDDTIFGRNGNELIMGGPGNDTIETGNGDHIVFGDHGHIEYDRNANPSDVDRITSTNSSIGGIDNITSFGGRDIILGGHLGDTIDAGDGHNIVIGDDAQIVYDNDTDSSDIDQIVSLSTAADGGSDTIDTGTGDDIVIGGRAGDVLRAGNGNNLVLGDSGEILAANANSPQQLVGQPITIGIVTTREPSDGGSDSISTGIGRDIVLGGTADDTITVNVGEDALVGLLDSDNIVLGDNGFIDWTAAESSRTYSVSSSGDDADPTDIDRITTTNPNDGGNDVIVSGAGFDLILAGTADDTVYAGANNDLVMGDHAEIVDNGPGIDAQHLPLSLPLGLKPFVFTAIDTQNTDGGGDDLIYAEDGADIVIGQQGSDTIYAGAGDDDVIGGNNVPNGHDADDFLDGGTENDVVTGDNASVLRRGDSLSPRIRVLSNDVIYGVDGEPLVTDTSQMNPTGAESRNIVLFNHSDLPLPATFGDDYVAGGADDDVIFGQLGDDTIQGDGSIDLTVSAERTSAGTLSVNASVENWGGQLDGDDYIEGNGGADIVFGNLGQDDIVGGSSTAFGLDSSAERPDGEDILFGGSGERIGRNEIGDETEQGHARDADIIIGDNGNIYRLVGTNGLDSGNFLTFNYDSYTTSLPIEDQLLVIPRSYDLVDYTIGGGPQDVGAADLVYGGTGDDVIHGMVGNDVLFGNGRNDDIYGGAGHDRIFGGSGVDGIVADDGILLTSRNGLVEPLHGLTVPTQPSSISTPGPWTGAEVDITGLLKKDVVLLGRELGGHDIAYGGLGDDWIHAGAGNDAISGAEALQEFYADVMPQTDTAPIAYYPDTGKLEFFDADEPRTKIAGFLLNFEPTDSAGSKIEDGKDRIFGDDGHDWLVGGTGRDRLFGGLGDDLMNADDNHDNGSAPGLNDQPDSPEFADGDFAFGGNGRDVLIANTGNDRLYDWQGEYNSYFVPFNPFGDPIVNRFSNPHVRQFLTDLGAASGADQSLSEPNGELGLSQSGDTGGPRDPQPGNTQGSLDTQGGPEDDSSISQDVHGSTPVGVGSSSSSSSNTAPTIGSFASNSASVEQGQDLILTADSVSDPDGTVVAVEFYLDSDGSGALEIGTDQLLGTDNDGSDGWSVAVSTAAHPIDSNNYFAQAADDLGEKSNILSLVVEITAFSSGPIQSTFNNSGSISIPDEGTVHDTLEISDSISILDLNVQLNISHTRDADLEVYLLSPSGTRVQLFADEGGTGDNFFDTTLDDEASSPISSGSAPFTGSYSPEENLSQFIGEDAIGTWTLEVTDDRKHQVGTLNSWSLTIEHLPPQPLLAAAIVGDSRSTLPIELDLDVNDDGRVSPVDALSIINFLNAPTDYRIALDVDRSGSISPLDALQVINRLNKKSVESNSELHHVTDDQSVDSAIEMIYGNPSDLRHQLASRVDWTNDELQDGVKMRIW